MSQIEKRKLHHLDIVRGDPEVDRRGNWFDRIRLTHRALPEMNLAEVDPSVEFLGKRLSLPLMISSMTGGRGEILRRINRNLAEAAEAEGIALAVGSQRVLLSAKAAAESFALRQYAPETVLISNLGAVQLNHHVDADQCRAVQQVLNADALYLHLNPLQEAVQPEGDTEFGGLADKIGRLARALENPLMIKEVGAGISAADAALLVAQGIEYIDVAGSGGTSWSLVEGRRAEEASLGERFKDWGVPTPEALRALKPFRDRVTLIASGGVRSGLDVAKSIILGASMAGMAKPFLEPAIESAEAVRAVIRRVKKELVTAMFLLGVRSIDELKGREALIVEG